MSSDDLNYEENRLKTFDENWPIDFISPNILAKTGFYYIGPHDKVKCFFCKVELNEWKNGDHEIEEHIRWSYNCRLIRREETKNVPLDSKLLNELLPPFSYDECGPIERVMGSYPETFHPDFPEYASESARLNSFENWPKTTPTPNQLSEAGFFYTQKEDRVICFYCGGGLHKFEEIDDDPFEEHAFWYSDCDFINYKSILK